MAGVVPAPRERAGRPTESGHDAAEATGTDLGTSSLAASSTTSPSGPERAAAAGELDDIMHALRVLILRANEFRLAMAREQAIGVRDAAVMSSLLNAGGQLTPRQLARELHLGSGTLTAILTRLEARGLVERMEHPTDRRATLVTIRQQGTHANLAVLEAIRRAGSQLVASLPDHPRDIARLLRAAADVLRDSGQRAD